MGTPATPTTTKLASSNMGPVSAHTMRQLVDRLNGGWVLCPCSHGHVFPSVQAPATHQLCTCSVCTLSGHRPSHGPQRTDPDRYFTSGKLAPQFFHVASPYFGDASGFIVPDALPPPPSAAHSSSPPSGGVPARAFPLRCLFWGAPFFFVWDPKQGLFF